MIAWQGLDSANQGLHTLAEHGAPVGSLTFGGATQLEPPTLALGASVDAHALQKFGIVYELFVVRG